MERRAGSSSASPEAQHAELASSTSSSDKAKSHPMTRESSKHSIHDDLQHLSPELLPLDEHSLFDTLKHLPISSSSYSTYPATTSYLPNEYHQHPPSYQTMQQNYFYEYQYPTDYSQSLPPTLPTMLPSSYVTKQESAYGEDDLMNPFSMNYASLVGLDVPSGQAYASPSSQPHVNLTVPATQNLYPSPSCKTRSRR